MIEYKSCPNCDAENIFFVLSAKDHTVSGEFFEIWECKKCTQRFTQNVPENDEIGKYYQSENYISHSDTSKGLINFLYHKVRNHTLVQKKKLIEKSIDRHSGNVLDVGAGTGSFLDVMKKAGWNATGIEPEKSAREKAKSLHGLDLLEGDALFELQPKTFDAITLWHVLEHVHSLHEYVDQLKKLISKDGKIFIAVPNYTSPDQKIYQQFWAAYDVPRHLYHFSPASMKKLLNHHGLKLEARKPMWFDSVYVSMLSEKYKTGDPHPMRALINGSLSNLEAVFDKTKCSSLIYVASL